MDPTVFGRRRNHAQAGFASDHGRNLARNFPQAAPENFTNEAKERRATDFKILLQRREVALPRNRELVAQVHSIKKRMLGSGKVAFDARAHRARRTRRPVG